MRHERYLDQHPTATRSFVRHGENVTVTIGRNVGSEPMTPQAWSLFQTMVTDHLSALLRPEQAFTYYGTGEWEGVTEESAAIVLVGVRYTSRVDDVDRVLSGIAGTFEQDAIGWSHGPGRLAR